MEEFVPVVFSIGSNLGHRETTIKKALDRISEQIGILERVSDFYYSEPLGFESPNPFCNVCCLVNTRLDPENILRKAKAIELQLGRSTKSSNGNYEDRTIDIDIVFYGNEAINTSALTIPHPSWQDRSFVTIPLIQLLWSKINKA